MPRSGEYSSDWSNDGGEREEDLALRLDLGRKVQKTAELALRSVNLERAVARTPAQRSRVGQAVLADIIAWGVAREAPADGMRSAVQFTDVQQRQANGGWSSSRELRIAADGDARWMIPGEGGEIIGYPAMLSSSEAETLSKLANVLIGEHLR